MKKQLNCLIVDDEPLARKGIERYISEVPFLQLAGCSSNALQAMDQLRSQEIDLMFLDIQMPKVSGLDLLKALPQKPVTIITSAFPEYALTGFELDVLDYLIKPVAFERFLKAVNKAWDYHQMRQNTAANAAGANNYFFVKSNSRIERIEYADVLYFEALQNYVAIHTTRKKHVTYLTMKSVEEQLPPGEFLKINKSTIISLTRIDSIQGNAIHIGANSFTIGRGYREEVLERLLDKKLLKRL